MEPTADALEQRFALADFLGLLDAAGYPRTSAQRLEPRARIVVAHALTLTGRLDDAESLLSADADGELTVALRSRAHLVRGLIATTRGELSEAFRQLQTAIRFAQESKDVERLAWSNLALFRLLLDGHASDSMRAKLADVRRVVTQAGIPQISAYLHECVAALEGQTGRIDEALRHCDIGDGLLDLAPNDWLRGTAMVNRACLAFLRCDLKTAAAQFARARELAQKTGHRRTLAVAENNLGHVERLRGKWQRARQWFQRVLDAEHASTLAVAAASDGLAKIFLATGDLAQSEQVLSKLHERIAQDPALRLTYNVRWIAVTEARLLLRRNDPEAALVVLRAAKETAVEVGDQPLLATLCLVSAQALATCGELAQAAVELMNAEKIGVTGFRELHGQHYLASALLVGSRDIDLERRLRGRAFRVWAHQGIVSVPLEMERDAKDGSTDDSITIATAASITNALAACIDLAFNPSLLGTEMTSILTALECSDDLAIVDRAAGAPDSTDAVATLLLGAEKGKTRVLQCRVPGHPTKAVLLADVLRIGRAAVELERYRQEERNRAALWPADPIETEAGALFLAEEMQTLLSTARRIAPTNVPVLITGETGTGKEVLARLIHAYSTRAKAAFLPFNCSATPKDMLDSQLFGHRRGAFTGATDSFPGVIRAAAGGTLFLDEIGETTLEVQPKLLRFLEAGEVHPIGEAHPVRADVRVIAATNADLDAMVSEARFRDDLFYRLNIVRLHVPPLRERRVEIPALANHYLRKYAKENGKGDLRLAEETMEYLVLYRWPGNVRQLANEIRRMVALAEPGAMLTPAHLSKEITSTRRTVAVEPSELVMRLDQPLADATDQLERAAIERALTASNGNNDQAAKILGLSRKGLYLKRQRLGLK